MKLWTYSLWLSIFSCCLLCTICLLPAAYSVFIWGVAQIDAGVLFPVLLMCWTAALFAFALNNIFIDKAVADRSIKMGTFLKCMPSLLNIPALFSFVWFIY